MRPPAPPRRTRGDDDAMLPLINVVFLLLIFFLLAGRLAAIDGLGIEPPASTSGATNDGSDLVVGVTEDGGLALDGEVTADGALFDAVAARLADADGTAVQLKADGRAAATLVVAVMHKLRRAGVERLRLLTVHDAAAPGRGALPDRTRR